jgi:hypothetical protein
MRSICLLRLDGFWMVRGGRGARRSEIRAAFNGALTPALSRITGRGTHGTGPNETGCVGTTKNQGDQESHHGFGFER